MEQNLSATMRHHKGKVLSKYRKQGKIPANIFEKNQDSISVWIQKNEFEKIHSHVREGSLVYLTLEKSKIPVLLRHLAHEHTKRAILHASFQKINLKDEVTVEVPIVLIGEAPALKEGLIIENPKSTVEITSLPTQIPEKIEVDLSGMVTADDKISAADLKLPKGVTLVTEPGEVIVAVVKPTVQAAEETVNEAAQVEAVQEAGTAENTDSAT